jgi:DNA-binding NarL/FixJ family response regulator
MSAVPHTPKRSLLIAEDHELARYGLALALEERGVFSRILEAENGEQAVQLCRQERPDVVLMDIGMPVMDGISATRLLRQELPDLKIVMLTSHRDENEVFASLTAGADAYCMKDIRIDRLCQVIDSIMEGAIWLDPAIAKTVLLALPGAAPAPPAIAQGIAEPMMLAADGDKLGQRKRYNTELTARELEVLKLIVGGKSNKEIAQILDFTPHTAKAHVCNIIQKLAVDDRTQAAVKALQEGLVDT